MDRALITTSLFCWALLWEIGARYIGNDMFPPLTTVLVTAVEVMQFASFKAALVATARAFFIGMALSLVVGITIGALMGRFQAVDRIFNVWVNIFLSAPLTALVPALMPILGIGEATVVATVFLFAVWVIIIDTREGVRNTPASLVEMARTYGATRWQMFSRILVPAAMPEIMTGIRLSVVRGVKGVIIGQIVIALIGFGGLFDNYLKRFQMERFWALVVTVFALGFLLVGIVGLIEKRLTTYRSKKG